MFTVKTDGPVQFSELVLGFLQGRPVPVCPRRQEMILKCSMTLIQLSAISEYPMKAFMMRQKK